MRKRLKLTFAAAAAVAILALAPQNASAQYPKVPQEVAERSNARKAAADQRSDEVFAKAQEQIKTDAQRGKPYIPDAARPSDLPQAKIPAFPGAWGGGMYSHGGRGGKVYVVTSLEDSGPGTFREACEAAGPRIVVFNVAGLINLKDRIRIRAPYITIAGNTAPGDGVCIAGNTVELETHDVIVRHMRFRRGSTDVGDRNDSIGGNPIGNVMIDHVSASWGLDENMSMYRHMYSPPDGSKDLKLPTVNITIQNSIFSECLNTYNHSFGSTIGGRNSTFHHNLWANNTGRNPSVGMGGDFTFVNNVLFNWRHRTVDGGDNSSRFNIINNYLKPGPVTPKDQPIAYRLLKPEANRGKNVPREFGKAYVHGNVVEGFEKVTEDNWAGGVQLDEEEYQQSEQEILSKVRVSEPFAHAPLPIEPAKEAYETVLENAGATLPKRDPVDQRVIKTVRTGEVTAKAPADIKDQLDDVGFTEERIAEIIAAIDKGIITDPSQVGGYPEYNGQPYADADSDGMPDDWESKHGLDPKDASDASKDLGGDGYTNVESFIYGIDPASKTDWTNLKNNVDPLKPLYSAATVNTVAK